MTEKFSCIIADPPWQFGNTITRAAAEDHYTTMPTRQIIRIPVEEWAADESALLLWTTSAHLPDAFEVMRGWGFEYKQSLVWVKASNGGNLQIGLGNWFRHAHELILFGTRGRVKPKVRNIPTVFWAPRGEHSSKPEALHEIAEKIFEAPYLELFARATRPGWTCVGAALGTTL